MNRKFLIKVVSFTLLVISTFSLLGCGSSDDKPKEKIIEAKTFTSDDLSITLTNEFVESTQETYQFYYSSGSAICIGVKEAKDTISNVNPDIHSLQEYAEVSMMRSDISADFTQYNDHTLVYEWENNINDTDYSYIAYITETEDAYWMIQFATLSEQYENVKADFASYFDSIVFTNN